MAEPTSLRVVTLVVVTTPDEFGSPDAIEPPSEHYAYESSQASTWPRWLSEGDSGMYVQHPYLLVVWKRKST